MFAMRGISFVNELYGHEWELKCAQRRYARFVNTTMMVTGLGAAVSDALEDGRVVSGVGGQYNFVAMAHALPEARSILCLRSTRTANGKTSSNVVWNYGHTTVPRHLRDIVVTEYGIADLRGRTDREIVEALVGIMDARFHSDFRRRCQARRQTARATGAFPKLPASTHLNSCRKSLHRGASEACSPNCRSAPTSPPKKLRSPKRCVRCKRRLQSWPGRVRALRWRPGQRLGDSRRSASPRTHGPGTYRVIVTSRATSAVNRRSSQNFAQRLIWPYL